VGEQKVVVASTLLKKVDIELHEVLDDSHGEVHQMVAEDELWEVVVASTLLKEADIELHGVLDDLCGEVQQMVVEDDWVGSIKVPCTDYGLPRGALEDDLVLVGANIPWRVEKKVIHT
jgi:hypothetical protein